tara:strand:+ start:2463 stop:2924 length:462 start_codon:yes stop_codon:yes gene_type:complete
MIKKEDILKSQDLWARGLVEIGKFKDDYSRAKNLTLELMYQLYDFRDGKVQFKPTKASDKQFRNDEDSALSYFIGADKNFPEDSGFAMSQWKNIEFKNDSINIYEDVAIVMGNYFFTDGSGAKTKVEYTFGYIKRDKSLKIILHHSSLPYNSF